MELVEEIYPGGPRMTWRTRSREFISWSNFARPAPFLLNAPSLSGPFSPPSSPYSNKRAKKQKKREIEASKMPMTIRHRRDGSYTVTLNNGLTINAVVTSSADDVEDWLYSVGTLPRRAIVGVDVKCCFPLDADDYVIALLSLCIGHRCLIFQVFHAESIPYVLRTFFRYSGYRFVCMSAREVANDLWDECRLRVRNRVDLGELAAEHMARPDLRWAPLHVLEQEVLGVEVNIWEAIGDWDQNPLSKVRIARACAAVFMVSEIGRWLLL